jgi:hypothetical protein
MNLRALIDELREVVEEYLEACEHPESEYTRVWLLWRLTERLRKFEQEMRHSVLAYKSL